MSPAQKYCGVTDLALVYLSPAVAGARFVRSGGPNPVAGIAAQTTGTGRPPIEKAQAQIARE